MAKLSTDIPDLVDHFGPTLSRIPAGGWADTREDDKLVKTHCCFCGQQCGIQLRVRENKIVGFEPWEDFPFNRGKLCPKGFKRYMQDEHPDRLKSPLRRVEGKGFVPIGWDIALDRVVSEIQRIQEKYGKDSFAVLTGASLTNEKAYLMGKFARVALQSANIDYNGRLSHGFGGNGLEKGFGDRPQCQSVERHCRGGRDSGCRIECCGVFSDHYGLHLEGARSGRQTDRARPSDDADCAQC